MASEKRQVDRRTAALPAWLFPTLFGSFLGVAVLKFGNPPIMAKFVDRPTDWVEWIITSWPLDVGYWLLGVVAVVGFFAARWPKDLPKWLLILPIAWVGWQFFSALNTVDALLTEQTLKHFVACAVCFYLGCFSLGGARRAAALWVPILCAFGLVIAVGIDQHFGGLEETRKFFFAYVYPTLPDVPPEYLKKISSDRIFSTLFYPNALAGAILLLLPVSLGLIWRWSGQLTGIILLLLPVSLSLSWLLPLNWLLRWRRTGVILLLLLVLLGLICRRSKRLTEVIFLRPPVLLGLISRGDGQPTVASRCLLMGIFAAQALGCLYWSGSKGGWLLALLLALVTLLHLPVSNRIKAVVLAVVFVCGVTGFLVRYASFFERGATSVVARFDYWRAAFQTVAVNPVFGSGPGTFGVAYLAIKKPESEMSRLAHNDYLQQVSDSGVLGGVSYLALVVSVLLRGYAKPKGPEGVVRFLVWLGFLGWALQGLMEFGLYIPALAWPAFSLAGWLVRTQEEAAPPKTSGA